MFVATKENFDDAQAFIADELKSLKLKDKEIFLAQLLFEENFFRLKKGLGSENFSVNVKTRRWLGDVSLILTATGEKFNPLENLTSSVNYDDENYYNLAILKANQNKIGYARKNNANVVSILIHEMQGKQTYITLACIVIGIFLGLLIKEFCSAEVIEFLKVNVFKSVREMFMNVLMMMVPPLVFFSVMSGLTGMSDTTDIGRIGGKFVLISLAKVALVVTIGAFLSNIVFSNGLPEILSAIKTSAQVSESTFSLRDMIVGIIPGNLVDPFGKNKILQVLFLAIFFGMVINRSGERANDIKDLITFMSSFCLDVMKIIIKFIPVVVFTSMINIILDVGVDSLLLLGKIIFGTALGTVTIILVNGILVGLFCKLSPIIFWRKIIPFNVLPFTLISSHACIPSSLNFCAQKLGIDSKLAMFAIPVGIPVNICGTGFFFSFMAVLMANTFGIEINFNLMMTVIITAVLISCTIPGVPGGTIVGSTPIFAAIGVPVEAVTIFVCIFSMLSMFTEPGNVTADISSTLMLAKLENKVDVKTYSET